MTKEEFLQSVREALDKAPVPPRVPHPALQEDQEELESRVRDLEARLDRERPQLLGRLADVARARGWNVQQVSSAEEAALQAERLVRSMEASLVVRSGQEMFRSVPVDARLAELDVMLIVMQGGAGAHSGLLRQAAAEADLGITGADYAVAETGSVILIPQRHLSRLTSLLPPVHLAIVRPRDVVGTLEDLFLLRRLEYYRGGGDMGSYLNFITGPSRTADIEQTIVIGAHGPREVHMLILDEDGVEPVQDSSRELPLVSQRERSDMPVRVGFIEYRRQSLEKELARIVEDMPRLGIRKVFLVGDLARGRIGPASNLTLVIIHGTEYGFGRREDFFSYHLEPMVGMEFLVYTPQEFEIESQTNPSLRYALERGRVVYDSEPQV